MPVKRIECRSAENLLEQLSPGGETFSWVYRPHQFLFRGHADSRFALLASALRPGTSIPISGEAHRVHDSWTNLEQVQIEALALRNFFYRVDESGLTLPEDTQLARQWIAKGPDEIAQWPPGELLSTLALAQHHGLPTRLLDWSRSGRIAAYFAAATAARWVKGERPAPEGVSTLSVWVFHSLSLGLQARLAKVLERPFRVVTVTAPRSSNPNLHAQQGTFTLVDHKTADPSQPVDRSPMDRLVQKEQGPSLRLLEFVLSIEHAPRLLRLLALEGISAARLFPGYGGVVDSLKEEELWDHPPAEFSGDLPPLWE